MPPVGATVTQTLIPPPLPPPTPALRTLLRLLARLYLPSNGAVLLDGVNLNEVAVHRVVAMVQQETVMFDMTIEDNVRVAFPRPSTHVRRPGERMRRLCFCPSRQCAVCLPSRGGGGVWVGI